MSLPSGVQTTICDGKTSLSLGACCACSAIGQQRKQTQGSDRVSCKMKLGEGEEAVTGNKHWAKQEGGWQAGRGKGGSRGGIDRNQGRWGFVKNACNFRHNGGRESIV